MTHRFDELYIPRCEHQQVVAYYKKLVVHMYRKMQTMQSEATIAQPVEKSSDHNTKPSPQPTWPADRLAEACNVVMVDFRQRRQPGE
ncbi:hypothetical protein [Sinorhizobium sp. RAC02]|uniref:hypothetical protein n=1 Tax=Sinorhizobium sp. RAC02 TaxID=1842534 RepID=UPI00083D6122|nr:hypothetical protein [Sinorhizobium sp. RAC02]AOF88769.1 hypothetical protein BSY16_957 [Sinorhizobium sp. RAC02]